MARGSLGFGIVRSLDATRSRARLAELCELLAQEVGTLFVPHHPSSYRALTESFDAGEIAVAWLPPIASLQLEERGRASVLALPVRRGRISYRGAIIARQGGPQTIADLRGRRIAWVDPDSATGYLVPRLYLQGAGFDVTTMFAEERFLSSHSAVVDAVVSGRFDAGATYCSSKDTPDVQGAWGNAPLRVIIRSGEIPNDAIVVARNVAADVRSKLLRWLLDLRTSRARSLSLDLFAAEGFRTAAAEHFEPLKRILIAARARRTVPPPQS